MRRRRLSHHSDVANRAIVTPNRMRIPILGYHKIGTVATYGRRLNVEASRLESHVRFFARRRFRFLTGKELVNPWPNRAIAFTFDDGFVGAIEDGLPRLERYGARGTLYVVTDLIGKKSSWPGGEDFPLSDWDDLRSAATRGHEIGNHTRTHPRFAELGEEEQFSEIHGAAEALAAANLAGGSFCLPYGSYSDATPSVLKKAGVSICMSVRKGVATDADDRLMLPRVFVPYSDALPMLLYRIYLRPLIPRRRK